MFLFHGGAVVCGEGGSMKRLLGSMFALLACQPVLAASFDCAKAGTKIEKTICADVELSRLDELLGRFYYGAAEFVKQQPCFKQDQREWLSKVRNRCDDAACLRKVYLERLGALVLLQPGMAIPNDLALPRTSRLRWIVPVLSESETPKLDSKPFQASGTIGYILDKGGFVLLANDGTAHTLIPELVIDDGSQIHLGVLKDMKVKVTASGRHAIANRNQPMFDNRHCIFIHDQP